MEFSRLPKHWNVSASLISLIGVTLAFAAQAAPLTKAAAERGGHVLVWDKGTVPGVVDDGDVLTDLDRPCDNATNAEVRARTEAATPYPDFARAARETLVARFGLGAVRLNVVDAHLGTATGPLFVVFPEIHLLDDRSAGNVRVHQAMNGLALRMTDALLARRLKILAAIESDRRPWTSQLNLRHVTDGQRAYFAQSIVTNHDLSGPEAIGELYLDSVRTTLIDDVELTARFDVAHVARALTAKKDFDVTRDHLPALEENFRTYGEADVLDRFGLRQFFTELITRPRAEVIAAEDDLCERRSGRMVEYARADAATAPAADVVYLQIGASHVHGVRERLRAVGASYLVLSPNLARRK